MFFSLDYLIANENSPLQGLPIVQPITGFAMKSYYLWVRCSGSIHKGRPFIQFYNNADYYEKIMNRRTAWIDENGRTHWSTMLDEEKRIADYLRNEKEANKCSSRTSNHAMQVWWCFSKTFDRTVWYRSTAALGGFIAGV